MADQPNLRGLKLTGVLKSKAWHTFYEGVLLKGDVPVVVEALDLTSAPESSQEQLKERYSLLSQLEVENVSKPLLFGEENGLMYMAVEKETENRLTDHLRKGEFLDPPEATRLVLDLAKTLKSIHDLGHIHGELSPSNVLFHEHGQVKVKNVFRFQHTKDYLLALLPSRSEYITPEHLRMENVVHQSDQYLLGLIFYHLLIGSPPFTGDDIKEVWRLHLEDPMPPLPDHLEKIEGLEDLLGKMLSKKSKERFSDDTRLLEALEEMEDILLSQDVEEEEDTYYVMEAQPPEGMNMSSSPGRESSSSSPEQKKRKSSKRSKLQGSKRNWKKKSSEKSGLVKKPISSRRSSHDESTSKREKITPKKESSAIPLIASMGAVLVIGGIVAFWVTRGIDPHERGDNESKENFTPVKVVNERPERRSKKPSDSKEKVSAARRKVVTSVEKAPELVEAGAVVIEGELSEQKKDKLKEIRKLPRNEAIVRFKLLLEDEDPMVRSIAAQSLVDLKGNVDMDEEFELKGKDLLDVGLGKVKKLHPNQLISYLDTLVSSSNDPVVIEILLAAMSHGDEEVIGRSMEHLKKRSQTHFHEELASRLIEKPGNPTLYEKARLEPASFLKALEAQSAKTPRAHVQLLNLWADKKEWGALEKFSQDQAYFLPVILLLAQDLTEGRSRLVKMLKERDFSEEQKSLLLSVSRSMGNGKEALGLLEKSDDIKTPYMKAYQSSVGKSEDDKLEATTVRWGYGLRLADLPDDPDEDQLKDLVRAIGVVDVLMTQRLFRALEAWPERVLPLMISKMKEKPDRETRKQILTHIVEDGSPDSVSFLMKELDSRHHKEEELELIKTGIQSAGELALLQLKNSTMTPYQKAKLLSEIELPGGDNELTLILEGLSLTEFKKMVTLYTKNFSKSEKTVRDLLGSLQKTSHLVHLVSSLRKVEKHNLTGEIVNLLTHGDEKVREEGMKDLMLRFPGTAPLYKEVSQRVEDPALKLVLLKHLRHENEHYQFLMTGFLGDEDRKVREEALSKMIKAGDRWDSPRLLLRLVKEEKAPIKGKLARHLLDDLKAAHPLVLLWGEKNLPAGSKKKIKVELGERGASLATIKEWKVMLGMPYAWPLKSLLLEFLSKNGIMALDEIYGALDLRKAETLKDFHASVKLLGSKAVPNLLQWMGTDSSPLIREELKKALEKMDVKYRLDPTTGKYISL